MRMLAALLCLVAVVTVDDEALRRGQVPRDLLEHPRGDLAALPVGRQHAREDLPRSRVALRRRQLDLVEQLEALERGVG